MTGAAKRKAEEDCSTQGGSGEAVIRRSVMADYATANPPYEPIF
jgi:hypothetical protein